MNGVNEKRAPFEGISTGQKFVYGLVLGALGYIVSKPLDSALRRLFKKFAED